MMFARPIRMRALRSERQRAFQLRDRARESAARGTAAVDRFVPAPRLRESDHVDVGVPVAKAWEAIRHLDGARSPLVRMLFAVRALPDRLRQREVAPPGLRLDAIAASTHGFRLLEERPGRSLTVGAIGKVWQPQIEFLDVPAEQFASFFEPGWVKIAWELRAEPRGEAASRITFELRVTATDPDSWQRFERYYQWISPFSHFIRRHLTAQLAHDLGSAKDTEHGRALPGDDLIEDAAGQATHGVTIAAPPAAVWPWLVQMGCRRAGWYSWDVLDNGGQVSARMILPELQSLAVGDVIPARLKGADGFEVLRLETPRTLILGGLYDLEDGRRLAFASARPARFWHVSWAFALEPLDGWTTRLHVRARAAFGPDDLRGRARLRLMQLVHELMETAQLRHLRERVEADVSGYPTTLLRPPRLAS